MAKKTKKKATKKKIATKKKAKKIVKKTKKKPVKKKAAKKAAGTPKAKKAKKVVKKKTKVAKSRPSKVAVSKMESRPKDYQLLIEDSVRNLEDQVKYNMTKGWTPIGSVIVQGSGHFVQTMVLHD